MAEQYFLGNATDYDFNGKYGDFLENYSLQYQRVHQRLYVHHCVEFLGNLKLTCN